MESNDNHQQQSLPIKRRRFLKITLFSISLLILSLTVWVGWIIGTESGLGFLVAQGQRWAPGKLQVATFQGRLINDVRFTGLSYQQEETVLSIASIQFSWEAKALLTGQIHVKKLHITNMEATLPAPAHQEKPSQTPPLTLPNIQLPFSLALDEVHISQIKIHRPHTSPFLLDKLTLRSTTTDVLSLQQLHIDAPQFNIHLTGDVGLTSPHAIQLHLDWSTQFPHTPPLTGQGELKGDEQQLVLTHTVHRPLEIQLKTTIHDWLGSLKWESQLTWQNLAWPLQSPLVTSPQGQLTSSGALDQYQIHLSTQVQGQQFPSGSFNLTAHGNQQELTIKQFHVDLLKGEMTGTGKMAWQPQLMAQVHLNTQNLKLKELWSPWPENLSVNSQMKAHFKEKNLTIESLDVQIPQTATRFSLRSEGLLINSTPQLKPSHLTWQNLSWPLDQALVQSMQGHAKVFGTPQAYHFEVNTHLAGVNLPKGQWQLIGQGNHQQVTIEKLLAEMLTGQLTGQGHLSWQPQLMAQLNLKADQLTLKELWSPWPESVKIKSEMKAKLVGKEFEISQFTLNTPQTHLSLQGKGILDHPLAFDTRLTWQGLQWPLVSPTLVTSRQGQLSVVGNLQRYQVNLETHLAGQRIPQQHINLAGEGQLQQFQLTSLQSNLLEGNLKATGQVDWSSEIAAQLHLQAEELVLTELWKDWPTHLKLQSQLQASLKGKRFEIQPWKLSLPKSSTDVSLQAEGALDTQQLKATLTWNNLQWPLSEVIKSPKGQIQFEGSPQAYQIHLLETQVHGQGLPESRWQALGKGDKNHFQLHHLTGKLLQGGLDLSGQVTWNPAITWELALDGKEINPGHQWTKWPGQLALAINSQGEIDQGQIHAQLHIKQIQGILRRYPLILQSDLILSGKDYLIEEFDFRSGNASFVAKGVLGSSSQLYWDLNVPNLSALFPEAKGRLVSQGELSGSLTTPRLLLDLKGQSLAYQDKRLKDIHAEINLQNHQKLTLNLLAQGGRSGKMQIDQFSLKTQGSTTHHTLTTEVVLPEDHILFALQGGLNQGEWEGQLQQLTAITKKVGTWQLQKPVQVKLASSEASLALFCLTHTSSALCAKFHWKKQGDSLIQARLEKLPLNLIRAFAPSVVEVTGLLEGNLEARLGTSGTIYSENLLTISPGILKMAVHDEIEQFAHQGGRFQLHIDPQKGLSSQFNLQLLKQSHLQGEVRLPQLTQFPLPGEQTLQGEIQGQFEDLHILPTFVPQAENTQGKASLEIVLGGGLKTPKIQGQVRLQNASTELSSVGLELNDINVLVKDDGHNNLTMQADIHSGQGSLNLQGDAQFPSLTDWKAKLNLTGTNFEAVNTPVAWALISPDMQVNLTPRGIEVTGKLTIPEAIITPTKAANGAVALSEDVIVVNPKVPSPPQDAPKLPISSDITLILGDKVSFKGAGFKSRLTGTLRARNQAHKLAIGNGELYIVEGTYKAYGQNLKVDEGRVIFAGGPIDNPGLDIRAFRKIHQKNEEDIIAGIQIQGMAKSPEISFYSVPSQDQSNILSYIMLGKPITQASQAEGKALLGAAVASQFEGEGESLTQKMAQQFGLDEAAISSEGGIEKSELVVGKYLSPDLYIGYGVGLFDASTVFRIRYFLTKRLTLETETGTQSGADLRYHFER